jgi:hypothetical protein
MKGGEAALLISGRIAKQHNTLIPGSLGQQVGNSAHNPGCGYQAVKTPIGGDGDVFSLDISSIAEKTVEIQPIFGPFVF